VHQADVIGCNDMLMLKNLRKFLHHVLTYLLTLELSRVQAPKLAQLGGKPRNWQRWLRTCFAGVGVGEDEALNSFFVDVVEARHARAVRLRERTVRLLCNVKTLASSTPLSPLFLQ